MEGAFHFYIDVIKIQGLFRMQEGGYKNAVRPFQYLYRCYENTVRSSQKAGRPFQYSCRCYRNTRWPSITKATGIGGLYSKMVVFALAKGTLSFAPSLYTVFYSSLMCAKRETQEEGEVCQAKVRAVAKGNRKNATLEEIVKRSAMARKHR